MSDTDLTERVCDLEERVAYLERELEMSVDEQRFERQINRLCITDSEYEIQQNGVGKYQAEMEVPATDLPHFTNRIDEMDKLGWVVEEASDGRLTIRVEEGLVNR